MPAWQPGNGQHTASSTSTPPYGASPAALKPVEHPRPLQEALHPAGQQHAFTYYHGRVGVSTIPGEDADQYAQYDDGFTGCVSPMARSAGLAGSQLLDGPGTVPCNLTTRLANRPNGVPLATIMEQCSRSTLNSRVSLLSMGRPPHPTASIHPSPDRTSDKALPTRDQATRKRAQEEIQPTIEKPAPIQADAVSPAKPPEFRGGNAEHRISGKRLSAFFRDVLHTVQPTSRTRPWSFSLTQTTTAKTKDRQKDPAHGGPRSQPETDTAQTLRNQASTARSASGSTLTPTSTPCRDDQTRSRKISSMADGGFSAHADPPLLAHSPPEPSSMSDTSCVPQLMPLPVVTRSCEQPASVYSVPPKPRDGAHNGGHPVGVPRHPSENGRASPVQYALDSVPACLRNAASLAECDGVRISSRNASFCSTVSTSYSGAVLGVDLDLDRQFVGVQTLHCSRSSTPVALPVWFTPQMAELERQASVSESPEREQKAVLPPTSHSMRSFALPSLLPIAAASGIVTPNYNTPKISFYSPSGNLIQPESSSSPGTNSSEFSASPTVAASYYNHRGQPTRKASSPAGICLPPARPALLPMMTPPVFSAPLPAHLRHHHNYQHREKSQIQSTESFIIPTAVVKGCGGIVKSPSFTPRSGTRHQHAQSRSGSYRRHHRSTRSLIDDLRFEVNFIKAGLITTASTACNPPRKGRTLRKRHMDDKKTAKYTSTRQTGHTGSSTRNRLLVEEKKGRVPGPSHEHDHRALGPLAGQALRICFCQPYDGAGEPEHMVIADSSCISASRTASHGSDKISRAQEIGQEAESELPNARIVGRKTGPKDRSQNNSAIRRASGRIRTTRDNVVSVGVGLRVATVGA